MSNGYNTYASYTELSSINDFEESQVVNNLTVTGKLTLSNPLKIEDGGTNGVTEDGARTNLNVYSKDEIDSKLSYTAEETAVGTWYNGKTIYRQMFITETAPTSGTRLVIGNIDGFDELVKVEGAFYAEPSWIAWPHSSAATNYGDFRVNTETGDVSILTTAAYPHRFFVYYTVTRGGGGGA